MAKIQLLNLKVNKLQHILNFRKAKLNHHQSNFKVGSVKVVFDDKLQESRPNAKITFQNLLWCGFAHASSQDQSHYREVPWWEIFMEQELRFGLDLGRFGKF